MAMRLFSEREIDDELEALGCSKTKNTTDTSIAWYAGNGTMFTVPNPNEISGRHSDHIYYQIMEFAKSNQK